MIETAYACDGGSEFTPDTCTYCPDLNLVVSSDKRVCEAV